MQLLNCHNPKIFFKANELKEKKNTGKVCISIFFHKSTITDVYLLITF